MADHTVKAEDDPTQLSHAHYNWNSFMQASKWVVIAVVVVLLSLLVLFVPFGG